MRELLPELGPVVAEKVERQVRRDWGGERPYIAKQGELGRDQQSERDERIRREHRRGDHPALLSRRHGVSERRIRQIVRGRRP